MKPLALFYHVPLHCNKDYCLQLVAEQVAHIRNSGLLDQLDHFLVGINASPSECEALMKLLPAKADFFFNDPIDWPSGEVPTLRYLKEWLIAFPDCYVCYLHTKGLTHPPGSGGYDHRHGWRMAMEKVVIGRWLDCVRHLDRGRDTVGQWWNVAFNGSYWAGNFWWASSQYLASLPPINTEGHNEGGRYEAELWIGRGPNPPKIEAL